MELNVLYNVHHQETFWFLIACYFYLTGLSAGSFIISTLAYVFGMERFKPLGNAFGAWPPGDQMPVSLHPFFIGIAYSVHFEPLRGCEGSRGDNFHCFQIGILSFTAANEEPYQ